MTDDPIAFTLFNQISIIDQLASNLFARSLPQGVTIAQFGVLNHFIRLNIGEKPPAELARTFQVTRGTMTSTLNRMQRAGLIEVRRDDNDGRGKLVQLTDKGRNTRQLCVEAMSPLVPILDDLIDTREISQLMPILSDLLQRLEKLAR